MVVKQTGLSLIELMIVIGLMGLLSLAGLSFTSSWVSSNRVLDGENLVLQAYARAKATALRNEFGIVGTNPAAALCLANNQLSVRGAVNASTAATCSSTNILWQTAVSDRLSITAGGAALSCLCLDNNADVTTSSCSGCTTSTTLSLSSDNENANVSLL